MANITHTYEDAFDKMNANRVQDKVSSKEVDFYCHLFFHVSDEKYNVGEIIKPNNYQSSLKPQQKKIEEALEEYRKKKYPNKPSRDQATFAFKQLSDAYYFLKQHGGYLYIVSLDTEKLVSQNGAHIGDMGIVELLMQAPDCSHQAWIAKYWNGATLYKPSIECLIDQLVVKEVLIDVKQEPVYTPICMYKTLIEFDKEYRQLLNKVYNKNI